MDPLEDWPKTSSQFELFLIDKYTEEANGVPVIAYTMSTIHHYEKIITTFNDVENDKTTITIQIDANTYLNMLQTTRSSVLPDGTTVTQQIQKNAISIYDYELQQNDNKKNIKLIKDINSTL